MGSNGRDQDADGDLLDHDGGIGWLIGVRKFSCGEINTPLCDRVGG